MAAGVLALAALPLAGCGDAGDDGGSPVGPSAQYTPGMDLTGSTLTASAHGDAAQGGLFDIFAEFRDGQGRAVNGMSIYAFNEETSCFGFPSEPTLTNDEGRASIPVAVATDCLPGSYTITVATVPVDGPRTEALVHIMVREQQTISALTIEPGEWTIETPTGATGPVLFTAFAVATDACNPVYQFNDPTTGNWEPSPPQTSPLYWISFPDWGIYLVQARARCSGTSLPWVYSNLSTVTVEQP